MPGFIRWFIDPYSHNSSRKNYISTLGTCREELDHLPKHTCNWAVKEIRTKWRNFSYEQYSQREKFGDPTWSSKPGRMGGEGLFCIIKWIFCFCSSHCILGCFANLVLVLVSCFSYKHLAACWLAQLYCILGASWLPCTNPFFGGVDPSAFHPCVSAFIRDTSIAWYMSYICFCR